MGTQKKSPEVRFEGFTEEWGEKVLGDEQVSSFVIDKVKSDELFLDNYISTDNMLPDYLGVTQAFKIPKSNNLTRFTEGDVLLSNIRPYLKKVWLANKGGGASNDVLVFRPGVKVNYKFLESIIKNDSFINYVMKSTKGVKMPRGDKESMLNYRLSLPQLPEQTKIGSFLKSLDDLITNHQTQLTKLKNLKKAMLTKMFPQKGASLPEIRFKGFEGEWVEKTIENLGQVVTGSTPSTAQKSFYSKNGIPWVTPTDIKQNITYSTSRHLSVEGQKVARVVPKNSILITCIASIGKNTLLGTQGSLNQQINALVPSEKTDYYFLFISSYFWSIEMKKMAAMGTMQIVNKNEFSKLRTLIPLLEEQRKIGSYFKNLDDLIENHKEQLNKLNNIKKACLNKLFVS